jgi:predicted Zn finger-like uncharacterized protein
VITLCPKCKLSLAVTAADLRVAQGQVRCGRCTAVFNALASLQELPEDPAGLDADAEQPQQAESESATADTVATPAGEPAAPAPPEPVPEPAPAPAPEFEEPPETLKPRVEFRLNPALLEAVRDDSPQRPSGAMTASPVATATAEELQEPFQTARRADRAGWLMAASFGLAALLVLQVAYRHAAALTEVPLLGPAMAGVQSRLGSGRAPDWDVGAYELQQRGVVAEPDAAGTLTVRASIRNSGRKAQPAPTLRLTLLDRFGNRVASRDLRPGEYAGAANAVPEGAMLHPGQRLDAEVSVLDPGGETVGFELDACLTRSDGSTACAAELAPVIASAP